jgi:hypothetical protein
LLLSLSQKEITAEQVTLEIAGVCAACRPAKGGLKAKHGARGAAA